MITGLHVAGLKESSKTQHGYLKIELTQPNTHYLELKMMLLHSINGVSFG